ncbi:MAG: hypothetical protein IPM07_28635 [Anaerolineales bacterium]|nr:hypothetical protein [Anaerolineales bacterium]
MTIKETPVTNPVNLSLFMVNLSHRQLARFSQVTSGRWCFGFESVLPWS